MPESAMIEAVHADRVGEAAEQSDGPRRASILDACEQIASRLESTRAEVIELLARVEPGAAIEPIARFPQRYALEVGVDDLATADRVGDALGELGFEPWERWSGGARRSFERFGDHLSFAATDDNTTVVRVRWRPATSRSRWQRLTHPTPGDWHAVALPNWAWRLYPVVRLARLAMERISPRTRYAGSLGPFLTTPASLLDPLLDLAGVGAGTRVIDLGCGDGRLVVAAAERGADAIGVEASSELVERARRRAAAHGVAERVTVAAGDARTVDLDDVDVVFAFLPVEVIGDLLPRLLGGMRSGATVLIHEQNRLPAWVVPRPESTHLVVGDAAVSVAHRWRIEPESA